MTVQQQVLCFLIGIVFGLAHGILCRTLDFEPCTFTWFLFLIGAASLAACVSYVVISNDINREKQYAVKQAEGSDSSGRVLRIGGRVSASCDATGGTSEGD